MSKIDKNTATKEVLSVLSAWSDGLELPDFTLDNTPEERQRRDVFNALVGYIEAGVIFTDGSEHFSYKYVNGEIVESILKFGVPLGEAFMNMNGMTGADIVRFAESMCKQQAGFFANKDARLTKKAVVIATIFILLP